VTITPEKHREKETFMYNNPTGPIAQTGVVAASGLGAMHNVLLAVTIGFTLLLAMNITRRGLRRSQR